MKREDVVNVDDAAHNDFVVNVKVHSGFVAQVSLHRPVEAFADLRQDSKPSLAISAIMVDVLAPITPGSDVVRGHQRIRDAAGGICPNSGWNMILKDLTPVAYPGGLGFGGIEEPG